MKNLTGFLCVLVLVFGVMGTANSATLNMTMNTLVANIGPHVSSEFNFTMEVAADGETVLGWTDLMSNHLFTAEAGGYDPRDGQPFDANEQVYPNGVYQSASTAFDGDTSAAGTTLWFRGAANMDGPFAGLVFNVTCVVLTYDKTTGQGGVVWGCGSGCSFSEIYYFHENAVPIPSAVWLLGSGLIGLVGFRKKVRKG